MRRFLGFVSAVALVVVAASIVVVIVVDRDESGPGDRRSPTSIEWRPSSAGTAVAYRDGAGRTLVAVREPEIYGVGWCDTDPELSRAFAGTVAMKGRTLPRLARQWADAVSLDVVTGKRLSYGWARAGGKGVDIDVTVPPGPCNPRRAMLTLRRDGDRAIVLLRDLGVPGALSEAEARAKVGQILRKRT